MEAGSGTFRLRLEDVWGGLVRLSRRQVSLVSNNGFDAFPVTFAAIRDHVDAARPIRQLVRRDDAYSLGWAIAFAASGTSIDRLPTICRQGDRSDFRVVETPAPGELCASCAAIDRGGERVIVCGTSDVADALRAEVVARGWPATDDVLHLEERGGWWMTGSRVVLDVRERAGALQGTMRVTPRTPPTGSVSKAALGAASRVHARSPRVDVGAPGQAYGLDAMTPLGFDGFDVAIPTQDGHHAATLSDKNLIFVEMPIARLAPRQVAYWRSHHGKDSGVRVASMRAPTGVPAGTRAFRVSMWWRHNGEILACPPGRCRVVGREPPSTFRNNGEYLLIPADGGTWVAQAGDAGSVKAVLDVITSTTTPKIWTLPAVALGKQSTAHAEWFWVERLLDDGDLQVEIDGSLKP